MFCFCHCDSSAFTHQAGKEFGTQGKHDRNCMPVKKTKKSNYKTVVRNLNIEP